MFTSIFIIDDDPIDCLIAKKVIGNHFGEPLIINCFHSAITALETLTELAKENSFAFPQFIFLDINMPLMDGFTFLEQYVLLPTVKIQETSVYMLSSSQNAEDISKAMQYKVVHTYFSKPLTSQVLETLLQHQIIINT